MTLIFTVKFIFIDLSHMCGHFIIDAFTIRDLEPFGITGNVWCGSPQKIVILLPKNVSFLSYLSSFGRLQEYSVSVSLTLRPNEVIQLQELIALIYCSLLWNRLMCLRLEWEFRMYCVLCTTTF